MRPHARVAARQLHGVRERRSRDRGVALRARPPRRGSIARDRPAAPVQLTLGTGARLPVRARRLTSFNGVPFYSLLPDPERFGPNTPYIAPPMLAADTDGEGPRTPSMCRARLSHD